MPDQNPNLIPLPSIGESTQSQNAGEIAQPKKSKLWIVVLLCVVVGIGLGVYVYQQSIAPSSQPTPKPTSTTAKPSPKASPIASPSPAAPQVNEVTPQSNNITFPKAGEVRIYFSSMDITHPALGNQLVRLTGTSSSTDLLTPGTIPASDKMAAIDSELKVTAGQTLKVEVFDGADETKPGAGWIAPDASKQCGVTNKNDVSQFISWATAKAAGEPLLSIQCWGDWSPNTNGKDTSTKDYNDYFLIVSYVPGASTGGNASPSPSPSHFASPSPSPSLAGSPSPSPSVLKSPSPSPSQDTTLAGTAESPSPRVTLPEGSSLPTAGVFEVTAGAIGVGAIFVLLGVLGLLLI